MCDVCLELIESQGKSMKTVDVVIPVHNAVHWLSWCLEELFRFESIMLDNVFVVNDRSEQSQSKKIVEIVSRFTDVVLINNENNEGGFGYACNLGASRCSADLILFLNTDCLMTDGVLDRLGDVFNKANDIALACPISNNSPTLTYPMYPGRSYRDMARFCSEVTDKANSPQVVEACTIVGNCLMVRRDFFELVDGFAAEWGVGYGEETDLHMKALSIGLKGVVHIGCYVYHFGGGTFNYKSEIQKVRDLNHKLFMSKWSREYKKLSKRCEVNPPLELLDRELSMYFKENPTAVELDVLFYLPGIDQGIGGIHAVIAICNDLIKRGLRASIALVGVSADSGLENYKEPILFNFLYYVSDNEFLRDCIVIPRVVVSTIYSSAQVVSKFALQRNSQAVQFVQGYEGYFENGLAYPMTVESYSCTEQLITTSSWLADMVGRHLSPNQLLERLPLVVNRDIFFPGTGEREFDICIVFRSGPDKGQWLLCEILDRVVSKGYKILVLYAQTYSSVVRRYGDKIKCVSLPLDQYSIARYFNSARVFVDASLHEGFGLLPLEAALCGCRLVVSDSGGVRDFVSSTNGELVQNFTNVSKYIAAVDRQLKEYREQSTISSSIQTGGQTWEKYFSQILVNAAPTNFTEPQSVDSEPNTVMPKPLKSKLLLTDFAIRVYRCIMPYLPKRLHLVIKVIIYGKV